MLVMQHEVIGYVESLLREVEISDEKLGLETIQDAIQSGSFLAEEHTLRHFRSELWFPQLLDRRFFQSWAEDGKQDMAARCRAMKDRLLREHEPTPMDDDRLKAMGRLLADAKRHLSV
jgi:trimethylamine--corrinoid protein Co-methyltransferase